MAAGGKNLEREETMRRLSLNGLNRLKKRKFLGFKSEVSEIHNIYCISLLRYFISV